MLTFFSFKFTISSINNILGSRIALDSLFLIYGFAALCMNTILIHDAKWIEPTKKQNGTTQAPSQTTIPVVVTITPSATNGQTSSR